MEDESITFFHSSKKSSSSSLNAINILVVDDDATCLTIVAAILKKFKYQVVTVNHPNDALSTLRSRCFSFDLVVADVHMPDMNGFQLQQIIAQEFNNLPVVLMSADDTENTAIRGFEIGAAFFILKPVMADDLRDLWQFAAMRKNTGGGDVETNTNIGPPPADDQHKRSGTFSDESMMKADSDESGDWLNSKRDISKGKFPRKETSYEDNNGENSNFISPSNSPQKRPKVIWNNSLHNRFLEAIRSIGLDRAVPKKILEVMNVPGLTRENVASHLQKYRIFLRRVSDASYKIQYTDKGGSIRPTFDSSKSIPQSTMRLPNPGHLQLSGPPVFSSPEVFSNNVASQPSGFEPSRLLATNKRNLLRKNVRNATLITQNNNRQFMLNSFQPGGSIQGQSSSLSLENLSSTALSSPGLDAALFCPATMNPFPNFDISSAIRTLDSIVNVPPVASSSVSKHQRINSTTVCLDEAPLMCPVRFNPNPSFGIPSMLNDICNAPSVPSNNVKHPYVGYSLSNIKHFMEFGKGMGELAKGDQTLDFPGDADQFLISNKNVVPSYAGINADLGSSSSSSSSSFVPNHRGEELLSNVIQDYQMSMSSGPVVLGDQGNLINEGHHSHNQSDLRAFTPFDLSEFDILPNQQTPLEALNNFTDQVNIQNQQQSESGEHIASSSFYSSSASLWDNLISSSSQPPNEQQCSQSLVDFHAFDNAPPSLLINKPASSPPLLQANEGAGNSMEFGAFCHRTNNVTLHVMNPPPEQREDDDFLDSLFAPFSEDQNFDGL